MRAAETALATALAAAALAVGAPAAAADAALGRALYETHCGECHYERIHARPRERSRVKSMAELRREVAQRAKLVKHRLRPEDQDDIAEYLNASHYRANR